MLPLKVIQQLIKESDLFKQVYIGKLDNKKEKSLGIYHGLRRLSAYKLRHFSDILVNPLE